MSRLLPILLLVLSVLGAACGAPEQPPAAGAVPATRSLPTARSWPTRQGLPGTLVAYPPPTLPAFRTQADGTQLPYPAPKLAALQATIDAPPPTLAPRPTATPLPLITPTPGGTLLRALWPPPADRAPVRSLYYSSAEWQGDHTEYAFWRVDLRAPTERERVFALSGPFLSAMVFGTLSPDGQYIAYLSRSGDATAELRVVRSDGTADRLVARPLAANVTHGHHRFVWSPDSTHLAFMQYWEQGQDFFVYDVATAAPPQRIARVGGADLGAWQDNQHILIYLVTAQDQPLQITAINITTGQQQALARFPRDGLIHTTLPAPDRKHIIMSDYTYNPATRQFIYLPHRTASVDWGPDSRTMLVVPYPKYGGAQVQLLDAPTAPVALQLLPPYYETDTFDLAGVAPDGQYVVLQQYHEYGRSSDYLLYDVAQDRWQPLVRGDVGLSVVGWR